MPTLRYGSWRGMHESGLTWGELHATGLTWYELVWIADLPPGADIVTPTRVALDGSRHSAVLAAASATGVVLSGTRRTRVQTEPPGGMQHGRAR
jgi:hypothetical protein